MAKVSIITPFFNAEKYFVEAIESVISQSHDDWELLLIDDGSRDGSTAIAKEYASKYPDKISYLSHDGCQNKGKSTSRNLGISKSSGEFIAFLDADDVYLPQKLEKQIKILQDNPKAVMVYGPTIYWYSWSGREKDIKKDRIAKLGVPPDTLVEPPHLLLLYLTESGVIPCTCGLLVKSEAVKLIGGFDESIQHLYEDQVFFVKACLYGPVFLEGGTWDKYRQHPEMTSNIDDEKNFLGAHNSRRIFLRWLEEYLKKLNINNSKLDEALKKNLYPYDHPVLYFLNHQLHKIPVLAIFFLNKIKRKFFKLIPKV